ncbi:hypothetical protein IFM89_019335 [Coptis chinensis]|uniref:F-box domain-containing protein n=1 Tax=Coptis chinensis TaxID=261450 RepID=A0A835I4E8_9MAGN|nr:hypothetical protein IFM89_019335 [Coptis chinensis]
MVNVEGRDHHRARTTESSYFYFSDELIEEILIRVPAKSLVGFKCVSKRWRFLISNTKFLNKFRTRHKSLPPLVTGFFFNYGYGKVKFHGYTNERKQADVTIDANLSSILGHVYVFAAHNGLLLCKQMAQVNNFWYEKSNYLVCNLFTKQWMALPELRFRSHNYTARLFCYDLVDSNRLELGFKVVYIGYHNRDVGQMFIYSSETREWEESRIAHGLGYVYHRYVTLLDESIYMYRHNYTKLRIYNLRKEIFRFLELPTYDDFQNWDNALLGESVGSVCYARTSRTRIVVWVLVGGEKWTLKHNVNCQRLVRYEFPKKSAWDKTRLFPLAFDMLNQERILLNVNGNTVLYDMNLKKAELINNLDSEPLDSVIPYSLPAWVPCLKMT